MALQTLKPTSFILTPELRRMLLNGEKRPPRGALIDSLRRIISDSGTFYGLPEPIVDVLKADPQFQRCSGQRDYVLWLLMERHRELRGRDDSDADGAGT